MTTQEVNNSTPREGVLVAKRGVGNVVKVAYLTSSGEEVAFAFTIEGHVINIYEVATAYELRAFNEPIEDPELPQFGTGFDDVPAGVDKDEDLPMPEREEDFSDSRFER